MSGPVKTPRQYDGSGRREQARATRRAVLAAATERFLERGYAATTMADVAASAGVAVQTVYSAVGGKAELLKQAIDDAIGGDDEPIAVVDRPEIQAVREERHGRRKLELYAEFLLASQGRTARLEQVLRVAADADTDAAQLKKNLDDAKHFGMTQFATHLKEQRQLRRGVTVAKAADVLVAHMDPVTYLNLVEARGWSGRDYARWYVTVTAAMLLPDD